MHISMFCLLQSKVADYGMKTILWYCKNMVQNKDRNECNILNYKPIE